MELLGDNIYRHASQHFGLFRRLIHPDLLWGWWLDEVARELEQFHDDLIAGRRPKLALMAPPQIGKSSMVQDFVAWNVGKHPDTKTIFASYSEELGSSANKNLQRTIRSTEFQKIFPGLAIGAPGWAANANLVEFADHKGCFRNTTVGGQTTGFRLDLGIIDDPVKGREEANSRLIRDKTWNWFTEEFFNRFSNTAGLLITMTRWHLDDVLGRFLDRFKDEVRVLRYPALAERDELHRLSDWQLTPKGLVRTLKLVHRAAGEPLFPEHKPLDFLRERQRVLSEASWHSLFQQNPLTPGGGVLPIERLRILPVLDHAKIASSIRYWDKGGATNSGDGAYTAGVLMHKMIDGAFVIAQVARGRWAVAERERRMRTYSESDRNLCGGSYRIYVEQEPGSAGQESVENTIRNLISFSVFPDKVTGSKQVRAEPFAAQVQGGNVWLIDGDWVTPFLEECEAWPNGKYKDQIDAAAGAFNKLTTSSYLTDLSWV